jgi:N-methylhydantoinase A
MKFHVASDIGGTFTDTVVLDSDGRIGRYKSSTVPSNPAEGVLNTIRDAAAERGMTVRDFLGAVEMFSHGTTVATNAMLEGQRVPVGLITTRGFGDTLSIMRGFKSIGLDESEIKQFRTLVKQPVAVPKHCTAEVTERIDYAGRTVLRLDEQDARRAIRELGEQGIRDFAVVLLWSFVNDSHERRIAELIRDAYPGATVTLSSSLLPRVGEYQRALTTAINAGLRPILKKALNSFEHTLVAEGLRVEPFLMQSNGGLATFSEIETRAAATVMSGPVGGVTASQYLGSLRNRPNIVTTDMGGTSFDVGLIIDGKPVMSNTTLIGRDELALPSVAVRAVGAGAGSIATVEGTTLRVGPESAKAVPGPACYGRGGTLPTVADADLVLGYLNAENFLGGRLRIDIDKARDAIRRHVAEPLGMTVEDAAEGIKTIVDAKMADLIRQMTVQQGYDPADFALFAYGGAGPLHAFSYGAEMRAKEIVVPLTASVHSAFGVGCSDLTVVEEVSRPMQTPPGVTDYTDALPATEFTRVYRRLEEAAAAKLATAGADPTAIAFERVVEMRFRTQIHVLPVVIGPGEVTGQDIDSAVHRFVDQYESRFGKGSAFVEGGVEITTFRVIATSAVIRPRLDTGIGRSDGGPLVARGHRRVYARGSWTEADIFTAEQLFVGATITGLAIVEMPDTTVVVGEGQTATVDQVGSLVITTL